MNADSVELIRGSQSILFVTGYQYGWYLSSFQDWLGTSDDKVGTRERPQAHGAFDVSKSLRTAKTPSFRVGHNSMGDAVAVEAAIDELSAIGADGPVTMRVATPAGVSERVVSIQVTHLDTEGLATGSVAVDCVARDPRRYDVNPQSVSTGPAEAGQGRTWPAVWPLVWPGGGVSGRITLTNSGRAPSAPTFILGGGFDTALITCLETGSRIGFDRLVPVGSSVVIDTAERRAVIDGQSDVSRWLRFREWELIPAGESRAFQFDATGVVIGDGVPVERRRNYVRSPYGQVVLPKYGPDAASTVVSSSFTGTAPPEGPASGTRLIIPGGVTGGGVLFSLPVSTPGAYVVSCWVNRLTGSATALALAQVGVATDTPRTFSFNSWTKLSWNVSIDPANLGALFALRQAGAVDAVDASFNVTGFQVAKQGSESQPVVSGDAATSGQFSYSWAGVANDSESIEWFTPAPAPTASLEGQVRSAWW